MVKKSGMVPFIGWRIEDMGEALSSFFVGRSAAYGG